MDLSKNFQYFKEIFYCCHRDWFNFLIEYWIDFNYPKYAPGLKVLNFFKRMCVTGSIKMRLLSKIETKSVKNIFTVDSIENWYRGRISGFLSLIV